MKTGILKAASAIVLGMSLIASAAAAPHSLYEEVTIRVSYEDLDINKEAGARMLYKRLRNASAQACDRSSYSRDRSLSRLGDAKDCFEQILNKAVLQVNNPILTKIHTS